MSLYNILMIHTRLKNVRKALRYKQRDIAKLLGVGQGYISPLERGIRQPSELLVKAYCAIFNVNEDWLKTGEGDMFKKGAIQQKGSEDIFSKLKELLIIRQKGYITETEYQLLKDNLLAPLKSNNA